LDSRLAEAAIVCRGEGLGWRLQDDGFSDYFITHFFWADGVYIVSSSLEGAKQLFAHFSLSIQQARLQ
jgi:hypothetical protein